MPSLQCAAPSEACSILQPVIDQRFNASSHQGKLHLTRVG
jgi:hypothetical protein